MTLQLSLDDWVSGVDFSLRLAYLPVFLQLDAHEIVKVSFTSQYTAYLIILS